jgi:hypothetical protein
VEKKGLRGIHGFFAIYQFDRVDEAGVTGWVTTIILIVSIRSANLADRYGWGNKPSKPWKRVQ